MKYIDWLIQWLENYIRPSVKVRTYERYRLIIEQHIRDKIGGIDLDCLSPLVLQRFVTERLQSGNKRQARAYLRTVSMPLSPSFRVRSKQRTCWD